MKTCFKCGKQQPLTSFYKHPAMADGHMGKCKECTKADVAANRLLNIDKVREYDRKRALLPHRVKMAANVNKIWRQEDRRRVRCHNAVSRAIRRGALERLSCEVCGSTKTVAHHDDYDKPLAVRWLCQAHHKQHHFNQGRP